MPNLPLSEDGRNSGSVKDFIELYLILLYPSFSAMLYSYEYVS